MIMEDYPLHYYFIGRLLGKALYENLLIELPLASFFLCKMTGIGMCVCMYVCMYTYIHTHCKGIILLPSFVAKKSISIMCEQL